MVGARIWTRVPFREQFATVTTGLRGLTIYPWKTKYIDMFLGILGYNLVFHKPHYFIRKKNIGG